MSGTLVTVTQTVAKKVLICEWCGAEFERPGTRGPDPKYCSDVHKQRAYEQRGGAGERGLRRIPLAELAAALDGDKGAAGRLRESFLSDKGGEATVRFIPPAGTAEHEVWELAVQLAAAAPARLVGQRTLVPARLVAALRDWLDECGVAWGVAP